MNWAGSRVLQLLGAGGVGYYGAEYVPKDWIETQMDVFFGRRSEFHGGGELTKVLSQLGSKIDNLRDAPAPVPGQTIVVRDSGSGNSSVRTITVVICVVGSIYAYLRFWRGLRMDDFKLVTQGSLKDAVNSFRGSFETMQHVVGQIRTSLGERIDKVKVTIQRIRDEVSKVHDDVRDVKTDVDATKHLAESCDRRLEETSAKQDYANRGIQALCAVVGEILQSAPRTLAIDNLRHFVRLPHHQQQPQVTSEQPSSQQQQQQQPRLGGPPPDDDDDHDLDDDHGQWRLNGGSTNGPDAALEEHLRAVEAIASQNPV